MPSHTVKERAKRLKKTVSTVKAKKILRDGEVRGKPLTTPQKGFFGARAGGN